VAVIPLGSIHSHQLIHRVNPTSEPISNPAPHPDLFFNHQLVPGHNFEAKAERDVTFPPVPAFTTLQQILLP